MKVLFWVLTFAALILVACGGGDENGNNGDNGNGGATGPTSATGVNGDNGNGATGATGPTAGNGGDVDEDEAERIVREAMPTVADLPGEGWIVVADADDDFDGGTNAFLELIRGNPECETLENLATLEEVFGAEGDTPPLAQGQVQFEGGSAAAFVPTTVGVELAVEEPSSMSAGTFAVVKQLLESDETANCLSSVLNNQFVEEMPEGVTAEVRRATPSGEAPENGARMAFEIELDVMGLELGMVMEMYFWQYGNADAQVLVVGTNEAVTSDLVGGVLRVVDEKLKTAMNP